MTQLNYWGSDPLAHKAQNMYYLVLHKKIANPWSMNIRANDGYEK